MPTAPQNLQATGGNARVSLSWQAPSSNGGSAITYYKIFKSTSSGTEVYLTTRGNVTSYTDLAVTNGITYFYKVTAVNSLGESPNSNEASATPPTVSSAPQNLDATAPQDLQAYGGNGRVTLSWHAPSSNGGSAITYYKIYKSTRSGTETFLTTRRNVTSYTDLAVTNGSTYFYIVSAINGAGESPNSNEGSPTQPTVPSAPQSSEGAAPTGLTQTLPNDNTLSLVPISKVVNSKTCKSTASKGWICETTTTYVKPPPLGSVTVYLEKADGSKTSLGSITDSGTINNIPRDTGIKIVVSGGFKPVTKLIHTPASQTNYVYACT